MGMCPSKRNSSYYVSEKDYKKLVHKVSLLQKEIKEMMRQREEESNAYEQEVMGFTFKEAEWKRETKRMREEIKRLRRSLKEMESVGEGEEMALKEGSLDSGATGFLVEQMREERARRDEAVEKWKMLYLAIKAELDDLIQRTHQEGAFYWKTEEEDFMEDIQKELKAKDETIEVLRAQLISMEQEECRRNREVDILRQSLNYKQQEEDCCSKVCLLNGAASKFVPVKTKNLPYSSTSEFYSV